MRSRVLRIFSWEGSPVRSGVRLCQLSVLKRRRLFMLLETNKDKGRAGLSLAIAYYGT